MAKNNKADMSCARVKKYTASDVSKAERHNERKNETYENMNVIEERIPFNVHFKKPFAPTYMEQLKQMETNGLVSLRGLRKDATLFNEIVIDVNTMYFERNGGYEYAKQFYEEAYHFIEEKFGADNVISAVMHADEINVAATEELGKEVYHYHLHAIPTSLSLRHLLLDLFRHVNQSKSVEHPINVGHTPDIPQRLGSVHYLSDFTDIVIHQQHGTPSKALAALSAVDPQLLGELISPALLQRICKGQAGHRLELVFPKSHHTLPEVLFAWVLFQRHHRSIVSLSLCPGTDIRRFSFLREVHAFLIRQIRGHRGTGQLQGSHCGGDGSRITLCASKRTERLLNEFCRIRLVDSGSDEQLPNLDRVEGQGVRNGL